MIDLGRYTPKTLTGDACARRLKRGVRRRVKARLTNEFMAMGDNVRTPTDHGSRRWDDWLSIATRWHQDSAGGAFMMVVWCNIHPTEVRDKSTRQEIKLEPLHVYVFDNTEYEHRIPASAKNTERYFVRYYLEKKGD